MLLFAFILLVQTLFIGTAWAAPGCGSELVYSTYRWCDPSAPMDDSLRGPECGPELYKECERDYSVDLDRYDIFRNCNELTYDDFKQSIKNRRREAVDKYIKVHPAKPGNYDLDAPIEGPQSSSYRNKVDFAFNLLGEAVVKKMPPLDQRYSCSVVITYKGQITSRAEECGVERYLPCRGLAGSKPLPVGKGMWPECGMDPQFFFIVNPDKLERAKIMPGQAVCPMHTEMSESNSQERLAKLAALKYQSIFMKKTLPLDGSGLNNSGYADQGRDISHREYRLRLDVALEYYRLASLVNNSAEKSAALEEVRDAASKFEPEINPVLWASFWAIIDTVIKEGREATFDAMVAVLPAEWAQFKEVQYHRYLSMKESEYALIFPDSVLLSETDFYTAPTQLQVVTDGAVIYRLAEAYVRTGLQRLQANQKQALELMDLRIRFARSAMDIQALAAHLAKITSDPVEKITERLNAYAQSRADLQRWTTNFITAKVASLEASNDSIKTRMWQVADTAKERSKDSRIPILYAYKALVEIDAPAFSGNLHKAATNLKDAASVRSNRNALHLLVTSARANLTGVTALQRALQNARADRELGASVIGEIQSQLKSSEISDQLFILIYRAMAVFGDGGPGAEEGLIDAIQTRVAATFNEFASVLNKIPELGQDP